MWRNLALAALLGASMGAFAPAGGVAWGQEAPAPADIRRAKGAFDDGSEAYRSEKWELAASHFEAADEAVPSERALRMAIRSRQKAGHEARAATLASEARRRYPTDEKTSELAEEILAEVAPKLHRLDIDCSAPCLLTVGRRVVPGRRQGHWTVYLDPGEVTVSAGFESGGPASREIAATAGGEEAVSFEPTAAPAPAPVEPDPLPKPSELPEPEPVEDSADEPSFIEHPAVFIVALVATAGVGGATIWSGVDTLGDPGEEGVRDACRGEGTACPEYQLGLEKQLRTNVLIGATAGLGVLTGIIGIFVTDWGGDEVETGVSLTPEEGLFTLRGSF